MDITERAIWFICEMAPEVVTGNHQHICTGIGKRALIHILESGAVEHRLKVSDNKGEVRIFTVAALYNVFLLCI